MFRNIPYLYLKSLLVILMIGVVLYLVTTNLEIGSFQDKLEMLGSKAKSIIGGSKAKDDTQQRKCYEYETKREFNITDWFLEIFWRQLVNHNVDERYSSI